MHHIRASPIRSKRLSLQFNDPECWPHICHKSPAGETSTKMKKYGKGIGGALLSLALVLGIFTAISGTAQAQDRNDDRYYQRSRREAAREARQDRKERKREWKRHRREERRDDRQVNRQGDWRRNQ